jgi:hypothetical protein
MNAASSSRLPSIGDLINPECQPLRFSTVRVHTKTRPPAIRTESDSTDAFNGIFTDLARDCGQNPHTAGIIEVSSPMTSWNMPWFVLDRDLDRYWYTKDIKGSHILFDLKALRVRVCAYAIKTNFGPVGGWHLKSWMLLGSVDGREWRCIDEQRGTAALNGRNKWARISVQPIQWFRFIRLEMTEPNHWGDYSLVMAAFELFGDCELASHLEERDAS